MAQQQQGPWVGPFKPVCSRSFAAQPLSQPAWRQGLAPAPPAWTSIQRCGAPAPRTPSVHQLLPLLQSRFTAAALAAAPAAEPAVELSDAAAAADSHAAEAGPSAAWQPASPADAAAATEAPLPAEDEQAAASTRGTCPLGYTSDRDVLKLKTYELPHISHRDTFTLRNLGFTLAKNAMLVGSLTYNMYLWEWMEAEEEALKQSAELGQEVEPNYPEMPPPKPVLVNTFWATVRDLVLMTARKQLQLWAKEKLPARYAWKLLKPWKDSLQRKAIFYGWGIQRAPAYFKTTLAGTLIPWTAEFAVSVAQETYRVTSWFAFRSKRNLPAAGQAVAMILGGGVLKNFVRCATTWAASAVIVATLTSLVPMEHRTALAASGLHLASDLVVPFAVEHYVWGGLVALAQVAGGDERGKGRSADAGDAAGRAAAGGMGGTWDDGSFQPEFADAQ